MSETQMEQENLPPAVVSAKETPQLTVDNPGALATNDNDSKKSTSSNYNKRTPSKRLTFTERAQRESEELVRTMGGSLELEGGRRTRSSTRGTPAQSRVETTPTNITPPSAKKPRKSSDNKEGATTPSSHKAQGRRRGRKLNVNSGLSPSDDSTAIDHNTDANDLPLNNVKENDKEEKESRLVVQNNEQNDEKDTDVVMDSLEEKQNNAEKQEQGQGVVIKSEGEQAQAIPTSDNEMKSLTKAETETAPDIIGKGDGGIICKKEKEEKDPMEEENAEIVNNSKEEQQLDAAAQPEKSGKDKIDGVQLKNENEMQADATLAIPDKVVKAEDGDEEKDTIENNIDNVKDTDEDIILVEKENNTENSKDDDITKEVDSVNMKEERTSSNDALLEVIQESNSPTDSCAATNELIMVSDDEVEKPLPHKLSAEEGAPAPQLSN